MADCLFGLLQEYRAKAKQQFGGMLKKRPGALSTSIEEKAVELKPGLVESTPAEGQKTASEGREEAGRQSTVQSEGLGQTEGRGSWPSLLRNLRLRFCTIL